MTDGSIFTYGEGGIPRVEWGSYQEFTKTTAVNPEAGTSSPLAILYAATGLAGEVGEACNKIKKIVRDDGGELRPERLGAIAKELGGACWYMSQVCNELGLDLAEIMAANMLTLLERQELGTIQGDGDDREGGRWYHCSPELLNGGIDCGKTVRRACKCVAGEPGEPDGVGHDHLITPGTVVEGTHPWDLGPGRIQLRPSHWIPFPGFPGMDRETAERLISDEQFRAERETRPVAEEPPKLTEAQMREMSADEVRAYIVGTPEFGAHEDAFLPPEFPGFIEPTAGYQYGIDCAKLHHTEPWAVLNHGFMIVNATVRSAHSRAMKLQLYRHDNPSHVLVIDVWDARIVNIYRDGKKLRGPFLKKLQRTLWPVLRNEKDVERIVLGPSDNTFDVFRPAPAALPQPPSGEVHPARYEVIGDHNPHMKNTHITLDDKLGCEEGDPNCPEPVVLDPSKPFVGDPVDLGSGIFFAHEHTIPSNPDNGPNHERHYVQDPRSVGERAEDPSGGGDGYYPAPENVCEEHGLPESAHPGLKLGSYPSSEDGDPDLVTAKVIVENDGLGTFSQIVDNDDDPATWVGFRVDFTPETGTHAGERITRTFIQPNEDRARRAATSFFGSATVVHDVTPES